MMRGMVGALINSAGIVLGGVMAMALKKPIPARTQGKIQFFLGVFTVWYGLEMVVLNLNGTIWQRLKLLGIVMVEMVLGKLTGKVLRLQKLSNATGQFATRKMAAGGMARINDGFQVTTALFCVAPLAVLASVAEGLNGSSPLFYIKTIMDGMATMGFLATFGWGVTLSAIPVLAWQGAIIRGVEMLDPVMKAHAQPLRDSVVATDGLLVFCVALIILQLKKVAVAEYLPSLAVAPLLTWWLW